jgi:hypothetical protein
MLRLLDANVLITANNLYYPVDMVPEFWSWLAYMGQGGQIKIPIETLEEITDGGPKIDPLKDWTMHPSRQQFCSLRVLMRS